MRLLILVFAMLWVVHPAVGQEKTTLVASLPYTDEINDIWGYTDSAGNEYALVGVWNGVSIVDVSTPTVPAELFFIPGPRSTWRDIKTWGDHAYVVHDRTSGGDTAVGMMIIDLAGLPGSIDTNFWTADSINYLQSHNIFIDENGIGYIFGGNVASGGAMMFDLANPDSPAVVGFYTDGYIHDGFVRGDTMWTAEIFSGIFAVVDVSAKDTPVILATQSTPNSFTHNIWVSDDNRTAFTTDERSGGTVAAYDVSDVTDIRFLDKFTTNSSSGVIPHNVFVKGNHLVASFYRDGVAVIDATDPTNLVQVDGYDTSPLPSGNGFQGAWGVYPYFNSGLMAVSDIEEGLILLQQPTYPRACYLEGTVKDLKGNLIPNARITILTTPSTGVSDLSGFYSTGTGTEGTYEVRVLSDTCYEQIIENVQMVAGQVTTLNATIICPSNVPVFDFFAGPSKFIGNTSIYYSLTFNPTESTRIIITDVTGRLMARYRVIDPKGNFTVGDSWPPGFYFAHLVDNSFEKTVKLAKLN